MLEERMKEVLGLTDYQVREFDVGDSYIKAKIETDGIDLEDLKGLQGEWSTTNISMWPEVKEDSVPYSPDPPDHIPVLVLYAQED